MPPIPPQPARTPVSGPQQPDSATKATAPAPQSIPKPKQAQIGDWGMNLPIGVRTQSGGFDRTVVFGDYTFNKEIEFDKIRQRRTGSGDHPGRNASELLALMVERWGNIDFQQLSFDKRVAVINSSFMVDVFYAYVMLRIQVDPIYSVEATCPRCSREFPWTADLRTMDSGIREEGDALGEVLYKLTRPLNVYGKQFDTLVLNPPLWSSVAGVTQGARAASPSKVKMMIMLTGIVAALNEPTGERTGVNSDVLGHMTKTDLEKATAIIDAAFPGLDIAFQIKCDGDGSENVGCGHEWRHAPPWQFDFFFGASSMRPAQTT